VKQDNPLGTWVHLETSATLDSSLCHFTMRIKLTCRTAAALMMKHYSSEVPNTNLDGVVTLSGQRPRINNKKGKVIPVLN
jgi:hypothetical protein